MSNPWFRLYAEFSHDPKVQMMSEAMQRRYVMIMCLRCSNALVTLHETEIAFHLRVTDAELAETKALFIEKGFIDDDWNLLNWEKRQFKSDSSAERVARHRAKKKKQGNAEVTLQKRRSNALDTDTDTDTDTKKHSSEKSDQTAQHADPKYPDRFADFWKTYPSTPRKTAKSECAKRWKARQLDAHADKIIDHVAAMKRTRQWQEGFEPAPLTYLNQKRWEDGLPTTQAQGPPSSRQPYDPKTYFQKARSHDDNNTIDADFQVVDDQ